MQERFLGRGAMFSRLRRAIQRAKKQNAPRMFPGAPRSLNPSRTTRPERQFTKTDFRAENIKLRRAIQRRRVFADMAHALLHLGGPLLAARQHA